jgi:hypothetical protein
LKNTKNTHEVQDLALDDEIMKPIHHLLDAGVPVPPMHVKDVDVCGAQFLKTGLHTNVHRFEVVSGIVNLLREGVLARFEVGGELHIWVSKSASNLPWHKEPWSQSQADP